MPFEAGADWHSGFIYRNAHKPINLRAVCDPDCFAVLTNHASVTQGLDTGLSQIAQRAGGQDTAVVWNFPIDVTFKTTNAFGWPRIALSVRMSRL